MSSLQRDPNREINTDREELAKLENRVLEILSIEKMRQENVFAIWWSLMIDTRRVCGLDGFSKEVIPPAFQHTTLASLKDALGRFVTPAHREWNVGGVDGLYNLAFHIVATINAARDNDRNCDFVRKRRSVNVAPRPFTDEEGDDRPYATTRLAQARMAIEFTWIQQVYREAVFELASLGIWGETQNWILEVLKAHNSLLATGMNDEDGIVAANDSLQSASEGVRLHVLPVVDAKRDGELRRGRFTIAPDKKTVNRSGQERRRLTPEVVGEFVAAIIANQHRDDAEIADELWVSKSSVSRNPAIKAIRELYPKRTSPDE